MKHTLLLCIFLGWYPIVFCQTGKLTGTVSEAGTNIRLELATVSLFRPDSSLLAYQLSDKNGAFHFDKLPLKQKLLVNVTYTGYTGYHTWVQLEGNKPDTLTVLLSLNDSDSNAVVVTSITPIRMNGDTLEINPAAFKMKEGAVVEELLSEVAGVVIWADGTITVNGRKVENVFVDGKPFLGSQDPRIATQNLPKTIIDKIQLYQEFDRKNIGGQKEARDSLLTMNIKLKEHSKKGYFGKAGAGLGTRDRFEADLSFQMYNKRSSIGIGGGMNNTNKGIGNLQELFQNNTFRNFNPNLYSVGQFGGIGITRNHSLGGAVSHNFIESENSRQNNRITVNYNVSGSEIQLTDRNLENRTTVRNPQFIREEGVQDSRSNRHDLGINYVKTNSYHDNLSLNGSQNWGQNQGNSSRFTEVRDTAGRLLSTNRTAAQHKQQSENGAFQISYNISNREDPLKQLNAQFYARRDQSVSRNNVQSAFESFTDGSKNTSFNRRYSGSNQGWYAGGRLDYAGLKRLLLGRYYFFKINMSLAQQFDYLNHSDAKEVLDYDPATGQFNANASLSNNNKRERFTYSPQLHLSRNFSKSSDKQFRELRFNFQIIQEFTSDKTQSSVVKRNLDRAFRFFRYEGHINLQHYQHQIKNYNLQVNYTKNYDYPSIDQLYTIVDDINVYNIRIGNPGLRNRTDHSVRFHSNYNTQNPKSVYSMNGSINAGYNWSQNPVTDSIINDPSGKRIVYSTNAEESTNRNVGLNGNISRKFGKNNLQLMYQGHYNTSELPNYIDRLYNKSESRNVSNQFTLQFSYRSVLVVNLGQTLQQFYSRQSAAGLSSFKNRGNNTRMGVVLNYPANFSFSSTATYFRNTNLDEPTVLWNAFATYRFLKQQGELKFSAMDLLKQYQNISNSVNPHGTITRVTNGLQQYFLLTFSYYPRKFGKKEIKRQDTGSGY